MLKIRTRGCGLVEIALDCKDINPKSDYLLHYFCLNYKNKGNCWVGSYRNHSKKLKLFMPTPDMMILEAVFN